MNTNHVGLDWDRVNRYEREIVRLRDELEEEKHTLHTIVMRELETMQALQQALDSPNLLRLVVQGLIFEYNGGE